MVLVAVATLIAVSLADQVPWVKWPELALFYAMVVVAFSVRVSDPRGGSLTPSTVLSYLAIYLFNPTTAIFVVGTGRTLGYVISRGWIPWRALVNGALIALSVAIGAEAFRLFGGTPGRIELSSAYVPLIAGPVAHQVANNFFAAVIFSRWRDTPFLTTWWSGIRDLFWQNLLSIPTAAFLAILLSKYGYPIVAGYLVLLPFQIRALRLYIKTRALYEQVVDGLVVATDVNFPLSRGHARRVADVAVAVAREMRLPETTVESIRFAALLHDVGMIGKDELLDRPLLSEEDVATLQDHVRVGAEIARDLPVKEIAALILGHHERHDGTGYPRGLKGEAIPEGARIIALAEAVISMAAGLFPYSAPVLPSSIKAHVVAERGRGFDPKVVDALLRVVERGLVTIGDTENREGISVQTSRLDEMPAT